MDFLSEADVLLKTFWYIALGVSIIFLIQTVMTFVGMDGADGVEADFDGDMDTDVHGPFQVFSLRNLINFLLGFGWTGVAFYHTWENKFLVVLVAFIVGVSFVAFFFWLLEQTKKLAQDNTMKITDAVGKTASVYLTIPIGGKGKVHVVIAGATRELEAISKENIPTGSSVVIKEVVDGHTLLVEKIVS
jgi:hypothetical protein